MHEGLKFRRPVVAWDDQHSEESASIAKRGDQQNEAVAKTRRMMDWSLIGDIFSGTLLSRVECSRCGNVSTTEDPFYDLSLEIPTKQQVRIEAETVMML